MVLGTSGRHRALRCLESSLCQTRVVRLGCLPRCGSRRRRSGVSDDVGQVLGQSGAIEVASTLQLDSVYNAGGIWSERREGRWKATCKPQTLTTGRIHHLAPYVRPIRPQLTPRRPLPPPPFWTHRHAQQETLHPMLQQLLVEDLVRSLAVDNLVGLELDRSFESRVGCANGGTHAVNLAANVDRHLAYC